MPSSRSPNPLRELPLRYRVLLRLLPGHVREEHGRELRDDLIERQHTTGGVAVDILRAAPAAHWDVLRQDVTLALRQIRRAPTFALIAGLTLALGLGGNVAFFTLVDGVLLRQLPLAGADRIVDITEENLGRGMRSFGMSPANFRDLTRDTTLFQAAAIHNRRSGTARLGGGRGCGSAAEGGRRARRPQPHGADHGRLARVRDDGRDVRCAARGLGHVARDSGFLS